MSRRPLPALSRLLLTLALLLPTILPALADGLNRPLAPSASALTSASTFTAPPPAAHLALTLAVAPAWAEPGEVVTFTVTATNVGDTPLADLALTDALPDGLVYVAGSAIGFAYTAREKRLTWQPAAVAAGQAITGSFQARVQGLALGDIVTNTVTATGPGLAASINASAAVEVVSPRNNAVWITPEQGGLLRASDERVLLRVPPGAVAGQTHVRYAMPPETINRPVQMHAVFTLDAVDASGAPIRRFATPLELTYRVAPAQVARLAELTFYYLDETTGVWRLIATRPDPERHLLVARIDHFSAFAVGAGPQPEPPPGITGMQLQLFSGALQVSYPLATLPGPGGLAPVVRLDYSTRSRAGAGHHQVAGWGWDVIAGGYILKTAEFVYTLVLDGVAHEVRWHAADNSYRSRQDPYLQIKRTAPESRTYTVREYFTGVVNGVDQFVAGPLVLPAPAPTYLKNAEGWDVTTAVGIRYHFAPATYYRPCGADGYLHDFQKWVVTQITDTNPGAANQVGFTYEYEGTQMTGGCSNNTGDQGIYLRAALLKQITYGANNAFTVEFAYTGNRPDRPANYADVNAYFRAWTHYELTNITMKAGGAVAWRYALGYGDVNAASGPESRQRVLTSVTRYGKDGVSALPATAYGYDAGNMGLLTSVANGYGGRATLNYAGACTGSYDHPECRVIEERLSADTADPEVVTQYAYPPLAGQNGPTSWDGAASGHAYAEATLVGSPGPTVVKRWFQFATDNAVNQARVGRETQTETWQGSQLLQRVQQDWSARYLGTAGVQDYHFVSLTEQRAWRSNDSGFPADRTGYQYDDYGNRNATYEYGSVYTPVNASFENGLTGWNALGNSTRVSTTPDQSPLGSASLQACGDASAPGVSQIINVTSGVTYVVRLQARSRAAVGNTFWLVLDNGQGGTPSIATATPGLIWQTVEASFTADGTGRLGIQIRNTGANTNDDYCLYVDDVYYKAATASGAERTVRRTFTPTVNTSAGIYDRPAWEHVYAGIAAADPGGATLQRETHYYYDGQTTHGPVGAGRLTQVTRGSAGGPQTVTQYGYDAYGNRNIETDPSGHTLTTTYDAAYAVYPVAVTNAANQTTAYTYDPALGKPTRMTDPNGVNTDYVYDTWGRLTKVIRPPDSPSLPTTEYQYTDSYTAATAGVNTWALHGSRIVTLQREQSGVSNAVYTTARYYDGLGRLAQTRSELDSNLQSVSNTRYAARGQTSDQYALVTETASNDFGRPLGWDSRPRTTTLYDGLGRVTGVIAPDGTTNEIAYSMDYNPADPDFSVPRPAVYTIDANRRFVRRAADSFDQLNTVTEFLGSWDEPYAGDYRTRYTYDTLGQLTKVRDHLGNETTLSYDPLGRKTQMRDPDMGTWSYAYDAASNLIRQTDAKNQRSCFYYDSLNRLKGKTYATGTAACPVDPNYGNYAVQYTYDDVSNGNNGKGRRTGMATTGAGANSAAWVYDARGRVTRETRTIDGVSYVTDIAYDSADRVTTLTYPADASGVREVVTHTYGLATMLSQVRSTTHNLNYVTGLTYNALGRPTQWTYGNAVQERRGYYGLGGDWDSRAGSGLQFFGQLFRSRAQTSAGVPRFDQRYLYDNAGNLIRLQEAATVSSGWPTSYTFQDPFDSKNTAAWTWSSYQTVPFNDSGNNIVKSAGTGTNWNSAFNRTATLSSGQGVSVRFKVDNTNPMTVLAIETADSSKRFGIYALSGKATVQYNDGSGWRYPADLIPNLPANTWYVLRIVLDDARGFYLEAYPESTPSLRSSYQQWLPTGQTWRFRQWSRNGNVYLDDYREFSASSLTWSNDERLNFSYDALRRLISAAPDSGAQGYSQTYQYNAIGNLTYRSDMGSYTYPPSGSGSVRPHAATAAGAAYSATYDANGNMLTRVENGMTYTQTWDEENRLKTVTAAGGQTITYVYDGDGRRVKKAQGGQTTVYIGAYYEKNLGTGVVTTYYYANGQRVAQRRGGTVYYLTGDRLGSTSLATDASGGEVGRQRYYPYGAPRSQSGTLATDYRFTGQRSEEVMLGSLYDYNARFYSPALGRFLSPDTIVPEPSDPQSLNRYSYVKNNPLKYTDPTGHDAQCMAYGPTPFFLGCEVITDGPRVLQWIQSLVVQYGPQLTQMGEQASHAIAQQMAKANSGGASSSGPPEDPKRLFRSLAEKYQYETSGTRFGEELRLQVEVEGVQKTLDVDGVVGNFLHESKFIDTGSSFYTTQIGKLGSGMQVHVMGWKDELYRLSLAAQQHGYQGAKVFINSEEAIRVATEMFGKENWFKYLELIYKLPQ